jgi:hypothetical protein
MKTTSERLPNLDATNVDATIYVGDAIAVSSPEIGQQKIAIERDGAARATLRTPEGSASRHAGGRFT